MKAGREIDALVARHVMGWTYKTFPDGACPLVKHWYCGEQYVLMKSFSTSISDAWQVVEKLVIEGKVFIVKGDGLRAGDYALKWTVLCDNQPRTDADTAPLAICLAALKAVGVEAGE